MKIMTTSIFFILPYKQKCNIIAQDIWHYQQDNKIYRLSRPDTTTICEYRKCKNNVNGEQHLRIYQQIKSILFSITQIVAQCYMQLLG